MRLTLKPHLDLPPDAQGGFVLPVVLFVLAGLALILTASLRSFDLVADELYAEQQRLRHEIDAETATARITYMLATQPRRFGRVAVGEPLMTPVMRLTGNPGGSSGDEATTGFLATNASQPADLNIDGSGYLLVAGGRPYRVSVQDANGLINLNIISEDNVADLLVRRGVTPGEAASLAARLLDYTDFDDEPRFGGGESFGRQGLPPPLNAPLPSVASLFTVPGWADLSYDQREALSELFVVGGRRQRRNVNTATAPMMMALYGLDPRAAALAIEERQKEPFKGLDDMQSRIGVPVEGDPFVMHTAPGSLYRLRIEPEAGGPLFEVMVDLDPSNGRPVSIQRVMKREGRTIDGEEGSARSVEPFPAPPGAFAVRGWQP